MTERSRAHHLRTVQALAGNRPLLRILAAYTLFTLIEYSVWLGMLVYAYSHGGATVAGLVAIAQLLGVAAVLPLAAAVGGRGMFSLDAEAPVPVVEIALLRSIPLFAELPAPAIEALAASLAPAELSAGTLLIRQGDPGEAYYAIAAGELDVEQDGHFLRRCGRGEGVGEIALLHSIPRTATVVAHSAATVYELDREPFLAAVLGHPQTYREASRIAGAWLAADVARDSRQGPVGN